ncbi:MAG TPA: fumarylacetoacetate hydrolase family protein, partial [Actinomycetota bacterium]|nr:fumarylacetoacetate hydrolase family protein [Actinomycetota bacterium]
RKCVTRAWSSGGRESRIFGYTLAAHWENDKDGGSRTSLGPCIVTPDHLTEARIQVHLRIDGEPMGVKVLKQPNDFFGTVVANGSHDPPFEAGDVVAWTGWTLGGKTRGNETGPAIEVSAEPIGVLSSKPHPA